jgi:hypothetical protein
MMDNMSMDGFCWMCAAMWLGGILLLVGFIWLVIWLIKRTKNPK